MRLIVPFGIELMYNINYMLIIYSIIIKMSNVVNDEIIFSKSILGVTCATN